MDGGRRHGRTGSLPFTSVLGAKMVVKDLRGASGRTPPGSRLSLARRPDDCRRRSAVMRHSSALPTYVTGFNLIEYSGGHLQREPASIRLMPPPRHRLPPPQTLPHSYRWTGKPWVKHQRQ